MDFASEMNSPRRWEHYAYTSSDRPLCGDVPDLSVRNPLSPCTKRFNLSSHAITSRRDGKHAKHTIRVIRGYGVPLVFHPPTT